jgi:predicted Zn-dependent protease
MAVISTGLPAVQTDESTLMSAFTTAMVEARDAKGSACSVGTRLDHFTDEAGVEAALSAIGGIEGERVPTGDYTVILGPQPVADLVNTLLAPACRSGAFYASNTPFLGRLGRLKGKGVSFMENAREILGVAEADWDAHLRRDAARRAHWEKLSSSWGWETRGSSGRTRASPSARMGTARWA